ncbi:MAG: FHA domain-containing protein [Microcoleaceae cyanobacterium MO_207.B10]|nr:FHA domain-containing protein [Microcoleaceae cyanobacterium MO_207.B10]
MITISLLHPTQLVPIQNWSFESESLSLIRIGRSSDNDVVIYSAVVSRHHLELWKEDSHWTLINFGANGTYLNNEPIIQVSVVDKMIIRLGNSGPKVQIFTKEVSRKIETNLSKINSKNYGITRDISQTKTEFE